MSLAPCGHNEGVCMCDECVCDACKREIAIIDTKEADARNMERRP